MKVAAFFSLALAAGLASRAGAQTCPQSVTAGSKRVITAFVAAAAHDDELGERAPVVLRERAERYMSARYLQHHAGVASGREAFVEYHIKWYHDHPPHKSSREPPVAIVADCDLVLYAHRIPRVDPQQPGKSYESVLFDLWRVRDRKADEHWDSALEVWHQSAPGSNDPEAEPSQPAAAPRMRRATPAEAEAPRGTDECAAATIMHNRAFIRRLASAHKGRASLLGIADQIVASDYVEHNPLLADPAYQGRVGFIHALQTRSQMIPGVSLRYGSPEIVLADCDHVATVKRLMRSDVSSQGRPYEFYWFDVWRIDQGQLAEHWDETLKGVDYRWGEVDALNQPGSR